MNCQESSEALHLAPAQKRAPTQENEAPDAAHQAKKIKMDDHEALASLQVAKSVFLAAFQNCDNHIREQASSIQELEKGVQDLRHANAALSAQASAPAPQQHDSSQLVALREELSRREAEILEKDKQLQGKDQHMNEMRKTIDQLCIKSLEDMKRQHPASLIQGPDDSTITERFVTLRHAITNFASNELKGAPFLKPSKKTHKDLFTKLNGAADDQNYNHYLAPTKAGPSMRKDLIFQAVIWTTLHEQLLRNPGVVFCSDWDELQTIKDRANKHSEIAWRNFHNWRAYTADFFSTMFEETSDWPWRSGGTSHGKLVEEMLDLVSRYSCSGTKDEDSLKRQLGHIVDDAVALSCVMAKSRALWFCCMTERWKGLKRFGFQMRKDSMDFVRGPGGKLTGGERRGFVNLIVQPAFLKFGTGRGEQYEKCKVVHKAGVVAYV